ncbi:hypothetical protein [Actinomadura rubrisoli]|uniref:hypothetical protein n=1 Tax=Actinomadura rubrisoli TaxID=2530368 RepID=UPI001FB5E51A|nr:hypothetical protein [Actinomadura rubrisoli]
MTQRGRKITMFLAAVVAAVAGLGIPSPVSAEAAERPVEGPAAARTRSLPPTITGRAVIIGIPGLLWRDVDKRRTPALWGLMAQGSGGGLSVRATRNYTCPTDGWLTLSAGQRARLAHGDCALPSAPVLPGESSPTGMPPEGGAIAAGWPAIKGDNAGTSYHAQVGLLGDAVHSAGGCTTAVGPGAVFGLGDGTGRVDRYVAAPDKATTADWTRCAVAAVDIDDMFRAYLAAGVDPHGDQVPVEDRKRAAAAAAADRRVAQVLSGIPSGTAVLVAGLSDTGVRPHLRVALAKTAGGGAVGAGPGFLSSAATRQDGLVTLTDLTATTLKVLGLPQPKQAVGSAWRSDRSKASTRARIDALVDEDVASQAIRNVQAQFYWILFAVQLILYGIAALALRRLGGEPRRRARILGGTRVIALLGGAAPGASFLAGLLPWWQAPRPTLMLICAVLGFSGLLTGLALAGPWRRSSFAPGLVITGVTALVLALDVMTGSTLQLNTLMGFTALVAGRFYGFGNQAFALFAVAAILTAAWLAEFPLRADRDRDGDRAPDASASRWAFPRSGRAAAVGVVAVVGVIAVAVDGLPAWGSDFGGVLAIVPAFAMLAMMVAGKRVSPLKLGLFCLAGLALVLFISYLNARSSNPTHLGRFWQDLMDGEAWGVIKRKFTAMVGSLGYWPFTLPLAAALGFLFLVLARPNRWRGVSLLHRAYEHSITMRPALICALAVGVIGTLVNDSGVVILSVAFSLSTPLMLAAGVRSLELDLIDDAGTGRPARPEQREGSTESPSAERP